MTPFDGDGIWLRCALHAHTTNSDGELAPDMLVRHYEWAGFDVLAITDHWVRTVERSTRKLLVIPSTELNAVVGGGDAHVLALGVEADPDPPDEFAALQEVVAWIVENDGVPYLAHTYWSGLRTAEWENCEGLAGIEVWNAGCELEIGRGDSSLHWDEALESGHALTALATDDSHHPGYDSGFAWTMVRAEERSAEAVLAALREGRFYGSTGPAIHDVEHDDGAVVVNCSPAESVTLVSSATPRCPCECGSPRLPECLDDPRARRARADHVGAAREAAARLVRTGRGVRRARQPRLDEPVVDERVAAIERLVSREHDLLVVGGGIVGAGIAEAATAHGLAVALVDRGDFAGATSSASSKLIHGGLRYLRLGDVGSSARRTTSGGC